MSNCIFEDKLHHRSFKAILSTQLYFIRSSHQRCSMKKGALINFAKFTGKHLCRSLFFNKVAGLRSFFNKVAGLRRASLLKKRLWYRCFPVNFAKFIRTPSLQSTSGRLLLFYVFPKASGQAILLYSNGDQSKIFVPKKQKTGYLLGMQPRWD